VEGRGYLEEKGFGVVDPLSLHLTHVHGCCLSHNTTQHNTTEEDSGGCYVILCCVAKEAVNICIYLLLVNERV